MACRGEAEDHQSQGYGGDQVLYYQDRQEGGEIGGERSMKKCPGEGRPHQVQSPRCETDHEGIQEGALPDSSQDEKENAAGPSVCDED